MVYMSNTHPASEETVRTGANALLITSILVLFICPPVNFYTAWVASKALRGAYTYDEYTALRTARNVSRVGMFFCLAVWIPIVAFLIWYHVFYNA